jgi:electron transport complex protein RnfG
MTGASLKNTSVSMVLVLSVTAITVGAILAGFFQLVSAKIEANRLAEERRAIFAVLEGAEGYDAISKAVEDVTEPVRIFRGLDGQGNTVGFAFIAEGPGFQGKIRMMVGLNRARERLSGLRVVEQIETPGLGDKIAKEKFESQFKGLGLKPKIEYVKNRKPEKENQIQAITGATISSRAVVNTINKRVKTVLKALVGEEFLPPVTEEQL